LLFQRLRELLRESEESRAKILQENDELLVSLDRAMRRQKELEVGSMCALAPGLWSWYVSDSVLLYVSAYSGLCVNLGILRRKSCYDESC
jgi:hypothetical protein